MTTKSRSSEDRDRDWLALLRGINVGRAKRVAMADLRELAERLGYDAPRSWLNSGNLIFTAGAGEDAETIAGRLERGVEEELGVSCRVTVLSFAELDALLSSHPLAGIADDPSRLLVGILRSPLDCSRLEPLSKQDWTPEALVVVERAVWLWCPGGSARSPLMEALGRAVGDAVTTRNQRTMEKLHALMSERRR